MPNINLLGVNILCYYQQTSFYLKPNTFIVGLFNFIKQKANKVIFVIYICLIDLKVYIFS